MSTIVRPYSWKEEDAMYDEESYNVLVKCWALDNKSRPYLLKIIGYYAECFIHLPKRLNGEYHTWTKLRCVAFKRHIIEQFRLRGVIDDEDDFITNMRTLYFYKPKDMPDKYNDKFLRMRFTTIAEMMRFRSVMRHPDTKIKGYEGNFNVYETELSVVRKLLTERNIDYASWFSFEGYFERENKISKLRLEYRVHYTDIHPVDEKITSTFSNSPGILAFDIETYSDNHRKMPEEHNPLHVAYMISCIYQRYKQPETRKRYGVIIGKCNAIPECDLSNCKIYCVKSEYELVKKFNDIIQECDPEIITGYNIFKFDYPYLDHRLKRVGDDWPNMSRLYMSECKIESSVWTSSAYGNQDIFFLTMEGRFSMDLYPIIQREYTRLQKYDLNTVSKYFLNKTKHPIKASEMFVIYEQNIQAKCDIENYPHIREVQMRYNKALTAMTAVMRYCIQDSELVIDLIDKLDIWDSLIQMSSVVGVSILDLYTRGQQARCLSVLYDEGHKEGYVINQVANKLKSYKGGSVAEPIKGLHDNVIALDFKSLYPSIIIAYNLCYTTLVDNDNLLNNKKEGSYLDQDPDIDYIKLEFYDQLSENDTEDVQLITAKFVTPKLKKGLLPNLVEKLIKSRGDVRKQIAQNEKLLNKYKLIETTRLDLEEYLVNKNNKFDLDNIHKKYLNDKSDILKLRFKIAFIIYYLEDLVITEDVFKDVKSDIEFTSSPEEELDNIYSKMQLDKEENLKLISNYQLLVVSGDKRQAAIKVSTNSFYGFLGVTNNGKLPLLIAAACITYIGRTIINDVNQYLMHHEEVKAIIIYGDTDSTMFTSPFIKNAAECDYYGHKTAQMINGVRPNSKDVDGVLQPNGIPPRYRHPLQVEFEKAMRIFCIKKKKYAALYIKKNGEFKEEEYFDENGNKRTRLDILKRGIAIARRDNCQFFRDVYEECLLMILKKEKMIEVLKVLFNALHKLINNQVSYEDLVIVMGIKDQYKSDSNMLNIFKNYLNEVGIQVSSGDRLDFVVVTESSRTLEPGQKEDLVGYKMRLREQVAEDPSKYVIDYDYYINKKLSNPLNQLIEIAYPNEINMSKRLMNFKRTPKCKCQYLDEPITFYMTLYTQGRTHEEIIQYFENNFASLEYLKEIIDNKLLIEEGRRLNFCNAKDVEYFDNLIERLIESQ